MHIKEIAIKKQKKMNGLQEMIFVGEIILQSEIAQRAAERLEAANGSFDNIEVWSSIQSILVATGNVSKILWPPYKKNEKRGEKLRQLLQVQENNILSERKFRNHFEHYDSRIDDWFKNDYSGVYIDLAMNPSLGSIGFNTHRGYNSFNNTLIFRGQLLDLNKVLKALEDIHNACKRY